jgi:phosphopantetheinyl transferase (holo-ACP synthase)
MNNSPNRKAPGACNTEGLGTNLYKGNFAIHEAHSKAISTQIAQLALRGHAVYELADRGFLVCKYGYFHHAPDFEALQLFAHRLGVSQ